MKAIALLVASALVGDAAAAHIGSLRVTHRDGDYTVSAVMVLEASPAAVRAALTDFAHLDRLSPAIVESRLIRQTPDGPLVYTRSRACVGWICRQLRKTELVTLGEDEIVAVAFPEQSNVEHSVTRWRFAAEGDGTRVEWSSELDPAFFVPPLIGPALVKRALRREAEAIAVGLERAARALAEPPMREPAGPDPDG